MNELIDAAGNFTVTNVIDETGADTPYTVSVEYKNGYTEIINLTLEKLSPEYEIKGRDIIFSDFDEFRAFYYVKGEYSTPGEVKKASESVPVNYSAFNDGSMVLYNLSGTYTFLVQHKDGSATVFTRSFAG